MLNRKQAIIVGACSAVFSAGCVPINTNYYRPYADIGKVENYACDGSGGAPNELHLKREGVIIDISADSYPEKEDVASIDFIVPQNKSLRIDLTKIKLLDQNRQHMRTLINSVELTVRNNGRHKEIDPNQMILRGDLYATKNRGYSSWYNYIFKLNYGSLPKLFYMTLPTMAVDNKIYPPFLVRFEQTHGTFLTPINGC